MGTHSTELPPDIRRLLDAERAAPPPVEVAARMEAEIARRLRDEPDGPGGVPLRVRLRALFAVLPGWAVPVVAFGLGATVGVGAQTVMGPSGFGAVHPPRSGPEDQPQPPTFKITPAPSLAPAVPPVPVVAPPNDVAGSGPSVIEKNVPTRATPSVASADSLDGERALIERARTALYRGSNETALHYLDECARSFPRGQLAEEREALWIQSAFGAAKYQVARERAQAFARQYPHSLMLPSIEEVLRGASD
jgi:hypothetical protein